MADSVAMEFVQSNLAAVAAVVVGTLSAGAFLLSSRSPSPPSAAPSQPSAKKQPSGGKAPTATSVAPASGADAAAPVSHHVNQAASDALLCAAHPLCRGQELY